jgi:arylsulfatase A-like enzyme
MGCNKSTEQEDRPPNVVIIFLDDAAYADFGPFAASIVPTPGVNTLASEGVVYTNFHVPQAICSASRAALLSGCNPGTTRVFNAHGPFGRGLEPEYPIMSEIFGEAGYATGFFGKWHIGDQEDTRPHVRGFDESEGLMYSNDMWKYHPEAPEYWGQHPIQYWKNGEVVIEEVDSSHQENLTKWYTEASVDFIQRHKDEPFFLYLPHSMPHVPLFTSEEFTGKSGAGVYGDVIMELDWSVGQINQAIKDAGVEDNTIIIFTSDNGPWVSYGNHSGRTPFREAKGTSFEGGVRSPCIIKYPNRLEAGKVSDRNFFSIDLLPTLAYLMEIPLPDTLNLDGRNVWEWITEVEGAENPQTYYELTNGVNFEGIMTGDGQWKLHIPHAYRTLDYPGKDGYPGKYVQAVIPLSLFDMSHDPLETTNVITEHPEIADSLINMARAHQEKYFPSQPMRYGEPQ